jgi:predicted  nucleic acid-binding Zn-ribbon protein
MFARSGPTGTGGDESSSKQVITKAMGVRVPPGRRPREKAVLDKANANVNFKANAPAESVAIKAINARKSSKAIEQKKPSKKSFSPSPATTGPGTEKKVQETMSGPETPGIEKTPGIKGDGAKGDKLESIKITAPGTYELNLPSLFEREELIMAVKEGTYFIDLTSAFRKGKKE